MPSQYRLLDRCVEYLGLGLGASSYTYGYRYHNTETCRNIFL